MYRPESAGQLMEPEKVVKRSVWSKIGPKRVLSIRSWKEWRRLLVLWLLFSVFNEDDE